jgi:uncharacterized protein (DUF1330 family)
LTATYVVVVHVPDTGIETFQRYEARVLPFLAEHAGLLERRLRSLDGRVEVHVVTFPSQQQFHDYRDDPRRREHQALLEASRARIEVHRVLDAS